MTAVIEVNNLTKTFGGAKSLLGKATAKVHAVRDVSFAVETGEILGIVGESGCGKTTLARMLVGLSRPSHGSIRIDGEDMSQSTGGATTFGRKIQYVFQDPLSSLNPRKTIQQIMEAPLIHLMGMDEAARKARIDELFDAVNLRREFLTRYPHEFSGGQAQRIGIARALAAEPRIMVLDEPVSALDVSVQAQVLNLLSDLRRSLNLTYLFISHDLAVVEAVSDRVAVLYFGALVELGAAELIFSRPRHPYTQLLANSAPTMDRPQPPSNGKNAELPDPLNPPPGCAFAERCDRVLPQCRQHAPELENTRSQHAISCFNPLRHE